MYKPTITYHRPPQEDVPAELITHYIVRDYQRMWNMHHTLVDTIHQCREMFEEYQKQAPERKQLKRDLDNMTNSYLSLKKKYDEARKEKQRLQIQYDKVRSKLSKFKQLINSIPDDD